MHWRLLKLNWSYGLGELAIVVAGVLIALAVDQWNTDRLARIEEAQIIDRLIADLTVDLNALASEAAGVDAKESSLRRIRSILRTTDARPEDSVQFLQDVIGGADWGWNQVAGLRTTYSELLSAGQSSLIQNSDLRVRIAEYYGAMEDRFRRIDERETEFPASSYRLVPRANEGITVDDYGDQDRPTLAEGLSSSEIEQIVSRVLASDIGDHVDAEINLAQFIRNTGAVLARDCKALIAALRAYRSSL